MKGGKQTNTSFLKNINEIFINSLGAKAITKIDIQETHDAGIAFTYVIKATYKSNKGYLVRDKWKIIAEGKDNALIILPYVLKARKTYSKRLAKTLIKVHNKEAINNAIKSRNSHSVFSLEYHQMNEVIEFIKRQWD